MCADADAIVLGEQKEGDNVTVIKWLRPPSTPGPPPETMVIAHLGEHTKDINAYWSKTERLFSPAINTRRFVAFLTRRGDEWWSMATYDISGYCGSCGLVWIDQGKCYRYIQSMNPGPYDLTDEAIYPDAIKWNLKTEKDLLAAIDVGMADAVKWRESLVIKDGPTKAAALAAYAMASTSPEQPRKTYRSRVREPLIALGKSAVPAIRHQIASYKEGDSLYELVQAIHFIGASARDLAPDLLPLLQMPDRVDPGYVLGALGAIGDKSAIPQIQPFLNHSQENVREAAREALKKLSTDPAPRPAE